MTKKKEECEYQRQEVTDTGTPRSPDTHWKFGAPLNLTDLKLVEKTFVATDSTYRNFHKLLSGFLNENIPGASVLRNESIKVCR